MNSSQDSGSPTLALAFAFELTLGLTAFLLGWIFDWSPAGSIVNMGAESGLESVGWGVAATAPMVLMLAAVERYPIGGLRRLQETVREFVTPIFAEASALELAALALAAGLGEELLFRGLIQDGLGQWLGLPAGRWIGLVVASLLFGLCHWLTPTYALLASLIGFYLGVVFLLSGNLIAPVIAHGLYDFIALLYLVRWKEWPPSGSSPEDAA